MYLSSLVWSLFRLLTFWDGSSARSLSVGPQVMGTNRWHGMQRAREGTNRQFMKNTTKSGMNPSRRYSGTRRIFCVLLVLLTVANAQHRTASLRNISSKHG